MKPTLRSLALAGIIALLGVATVQAQVAQQVTQTGSKLDVASGLFGPLGGATTCNSVNTTAANGTVTIRPPGGQFVYVTGVYIDIVSDVTATTQVSTMSTTNLSGAPFWSLATVVNASGQQESFRQISETYTTPFKSTVPGTNVTFVPSAQIANQIVCIRVAAYFGY